jgi:hypothetical protein
MTKARDVATQGGLVLLNTTSFSAAASVSVSNIFTSDYQNYKVVVNSIVAAGNPFLYGRFRENTTDKATGYYGANGVVTYLGAVSSFASFNNAAQFSFGYLQNAASANYHTLSIDVLRSSATFGSMSGTFFDPYGAQAGFVGVRNDTMTNFSGISFLPSSSTFTGTIKVYGYR